MIQMLVVLLAIGTASLSLADPITPEAAMDAALSKPKPPEPEKATIPAKKPVKAKPASKKTPVKKPTTAVLAPVKKDPPKPKGEAPEPQPIEPTQKPIVIENPNLL